MAENRLPDVPLKLETKKVIVGYWDKSRGLIEPIKLALAVAGVEYIERNPKYGPPPHFDNADWMENKHEVLEGYDFPNLPFYQDEEVRITQFKAILQHLARKHDLMPERSDERTRIDVDVLASVADDLFTTESKYLYHPDHRLKGTEPTEQEKGDKRKEYQASVKRQLKPLETKKSKSPGQFFFGDKLTWIDILLFDLLDHVVALEGPEFFGELPNLAQFLDNVSQVPRIKEYRGSEKFRKYPLFTHKAFVGRQAEDVPKL